jgi:spore cortex formation protein SpoVR/YcgB (stage V sporulation)
MNNTNRGLGNLLIATSSIGGHTVLPYPYSIPKGILDSAEVVIVNDLEIHVVNSQRAFDFEKDFQKIIKEQDELRLVKPEEGKKQLSEIVEQERGVKFVRKEFTVPEFIEDDSYFMRKPKKPNAGIHIGSYKKHPKKSKPKYYGR